MKSKLWAFAGLAVMAGIGAFAWASYRGDTDATPTPVASDKSASSAPAGHRWFDKVEPGVTQATPKSPPVYAVNAFGKPLDLEGMTVSQYIKNLRDAASKGDSNAAFNIYSAETLCVNLPKDQRELANIPANSKDNYTEALRSVVKNSETACADFNVSPKERMDYLHAAANGGNVRALEMSAVEAPEGIDPLKPLDLNDPRSVQWEKDTIKYLTQAAAKGSAYSMTTLSTIYEQGDLEKQDIPLALTYQIAALMKIRPNADIPDNSPSISKMTSQLTPDQIATARANAVALIKSSAK